MLRGGPGHPPYHAQHFPGGHINQMRVLGIPIDRFKTEAQVRLAVDYLNRSPANIKNLQTQKSVLLGRLRILSRENGNGKRKA